MTGDRWGPGDPPAPNGHFLLPNIGGCQFVRFSGLTAQKFQPSPAQSQLSLEVEPVWFAFLQTYPSTCIFAFENAFQDPTEFYYGGSAIVVQNEPGSSAPSLADIMELLNMQGRESRRAEAFPLDNSHLVAMFADQVESTRIRIKYNFS